jgi:hypothetical protein
LNYKQPIFDEQKQVSSVFQKKTGRFKFMDRSAGDAKWVPHSWSGGQKGTSADSSALQPGEAPVIKLTHLSPTFADPSAAPTSHQLNSQHIPQPTTATNPRPHLYCSSPVPRGHAPHLRGRPLALPVPPARAGSPVPPPLCALPVRTTALSHVMCGRQQHVSTSFSPYFWVIPIQ